MKIALLILSFLFSLLAALCLAAEEFTSVPGLPVTTNMAVDRILVIGAFVASGLSVPKPAAGVFVLWPLVITSLVTKIVLHQLPFTGSIFVFGTMAAITLSLVWKGERRKLLVK